MNRQLSLFTLWRPGWQSETLDSGYARSAMDDSGVNPLAGTTLNLDKPDHFFNTAFDVMNSLCGASTVAIDNKIEQAMDLVKSHLMFAVREEVEVLKEQIKELLEKNNQLEYENSILKAAATPETLTQLQQSQQQPPAAANS